MAEPFLGDDPEVVAVVGDLTTRLVEPAAPPMPCSAGYAPVIIELVAAGVIDGKIVTDS